MKIRYLVIAMILILSVALVGCGNKATEQAPVPTAPSEPAASEPTAPATEQAAAETPTAGEAAATETEQIVDVPETEMGPGLVTDEDIETGDYVQHSLIGEPTNKDSEMARDFTAEPVRFSNFDCKMDEETSVRYISVKVTNTNADQSFMISPKGVAKGYNTYFMVRGLVDKDPGCGVEELLPGESTVCNKIGMDDARFGNPEGTNRLTIQSPDNDGKYISEAVVVNC